MTKETLYKYIESPQDLNQSSLTDLEHLVREYPWFQTARILLLKNLSNLSHPLFLHELPVTAAYVGDRNSLYKFIHSQKKKTETSEKTIALTEEEPSIAQFVPSFDNKEVLVSEQETEMISGKQETSINEAQDFPSKLILKEKVVEFIPKNNADSNEKYKEIEESVSKARDEVFSSKEDTSSSSKPIEEVKSGIITLINTNPELDTNETAISPKTSQQSEILSFSEWLTQMSQFEESKQDKVELKTATEELTEDIEPAKLGGKKNAQWDILDNFMSNYKRPIPQKQEEILLDEAVEDLSEIQKKTKEEVLSETLARIYVKQKDYKKAISTYKKLSLKYPKKSTYFASRIKKLKKKSKNDKRKK